MRVGVEEAVDHDLLVEGLQQLPRGLLARRALGRRRDRPARHVAHHEQTRRRVVAVDLRDAQPAERRDHVRHPAHVARLLPEVQLAMQRVRQVREHRLHVDHLLQPRAVTDLLGEDLEQRQVLFDLLLRVGTLDLHHDLLAVRERRAMHLGDRAGGERLRLDVVEHVLPRHAQLLLHDAHDLLLGERRHVVLQRRELLDVLGRQQVGARRQDLAELRERRTQLLERGAQALALPFLADRAFLVGAAEQLLQAVLGEDGGDLGAARHQVRLGLDLGGARAKRRRRARGAGGSGGLPVPRGVHDDHGAARVVADPVRHVAQQELLAAGHAGVADHEHVDPVLLGGVDDRHGGVVVDHDVRVAAIAGDLARIGLQLVGGTAGLRRLGGAELGVDRVARQDHLHDVEVGGVQLSERGRPSDGALGGHRAIGPHHHAADRPLRTDVAVRAHPRIIPDGGRCRRAGKPPWFAGAGTPVR